MPHVIAPESMRKTVNKFTIITDSSNIQLNVHYGDHFHNRYYDKKTEYLSHHPKNE